MAKARLHTGEVLEFDDDVSDDDIDAAVAAHLAQKEVWKAIAAEIRGVREAVYKTSADIIRATNSPRITTLVKDGEGKPSKSITTVTSSIFEEQHG